MDNDNEIEVQARPSPFQFLLFREIAKIIDPIFSRPTPR
jgi:hypothetical protein